MYDGSIKILSEVRYIPAVKRNLISLGSLERKGFHFSSGDGKMIVYKGNTTFMLAKRVHNLYYLNAEIINGEVNLLEKADRRIWHMRLGHVGDAGLKELEIKRIIPTLDGGSGESMAGCEECILAKNKKLSFHKAKHCSKAPLDYAHSDVWGPAQTQSIGGGRYFLSIIDDYSRKLWLYVMKDKSEAFSKFQEWCSEVESEKSSHLKCLRTDNGLEFLSSEFDKYCKKKGIKRHRIVPSNPQ